MNKYDVPLIPEPCIKCGLVMGERVILADGIEKPLCENCFERFLAYIIEKKEISHE